VIWFNLVFSFLVAFFWLRWFRKKDKFEKEPERLIYIAFFAGVLATIPSIILEFPLHINITPGYARPVGRQSFQELWFAIIVENHFLWMKKMSL
jgi:hypothetical protein